MTTVEDGLVYKGNRIVTEHPGLGHYSEFYVLFLEKKLEEYKLLRLSVIQYAEAKGIRNPEEFPDRLIQQRREDPE